MKNNEFLNKIKELYNKYKEAKKDPRKKAGIKLLGYFIFFFIIMLIAGISNNIEPTNNTHPNTTTTTTTKVVDKYVEKQNKLLDDKYNIKYTITYNNNIYNINGTIENNIINGYFEIDNDIKKVIIKNNELYEIINEEENILSVEFNKNYINPSYILNKIKGNSAFIQEKDNMKTYLYEVEENDYIIDIYIITSENSITKIKINELNNEYILSFDN